MRFLFYMTSILYYKRTLEFELGKHRFAIVIAFSDRGDIWFGDSQVRSSSALVPPWSTACQDRPGAAPDPPRIRPGSAPDPPWYQGGYGALAARTGLHNNNPVRSNAAPIACQCHPNQLERIWMGSVTETANCLPRLPVQRPANYLPKFPRNANGVYFRFSCDQVYFLLPPHLITENYMYKYEYNNGKRMLH